MRAFRWVLLVIGVLVVLALWPVCVPGRHGGVMVYQAVSITLALPDSGEVDSLERQMTELICIVDDQQTTIDGLLDSQEIQQETIEDLILILAKERAGRSKNNSWNGENVKTSIWTNAEGAGVD